MDQLARRSKRLPRRTIQEPMIVIVALAGIEGAGLNYRERLWAAVSIRRPRGLALRRNTAPFDRSTRVPEGKCRLSVLDLIMDRRLAVGNVGIGQHTLVNE